MATIYDVARRAGVSPYTVSSVVNHSARVSVELTERVMEAVKALDYTANEVARSLPTGRTSTVGMLIPDIANPFYAKVVRGVEDRLQPEGYSLILSSTYNRIRNESRHLHLFRARQVDGLLLFCSGAEDDIRPLTASGKPVVFLGRLPSTIEADSVVSDSGLGSRLAVDHLVSNGHRRIAMAMGQLTHSTNATRVTAWRAAMRKHGLGAPDAYVGDGDWTAQSGYDIMLGFFDLPQPPTAVFAANFLMMTGVLRALRERGLRCPRDVEVVSSDDSDWLDVFEPPITTVVTSSYAMGEAAADLMLKRMRQPGRKFQTIVIEPELRVRRPRGEA